MTKARWGVVLAAGAMACFLFGCQDEEVEPSWFYLTTQNSELPSDTVYGCYVAGEDAWYATDAGLAYNRLTTWRIYTTASGLPSDAVYAVVGGPAGEIWAATEAGVVRVRGESLTVFTQADGLPADRAVALTYDGAAVWCATEGGIARFDDPGWTAFTSADGLPADDARDVYAESKEKIWVACMGGAALYDRGVITAYTPANAGLPSAAVYAAAARPGGDAWLGTDDGLCRFRDGQVVEVYTAGGGSGLKNDVINDLGFDAKGVLWVATVGGASRRSGAGFQTFGEEMGLTSAYCLSVWGDKYGYVWLGTLGGGVNRYGPD